LTTYEITSKKYRDMMIWYGLKRAEEDNASGGLVMPHEGINELCLGETVSASNLGKDDASFIYRGRTCKWEDGRWRWT